nr:unnamed protein product [Callosobruchus analis]
MVSAKVLVGVFVCLMVMSSVMDSVEAAVDCSTLKHPYGGKKTCVRQCTRFCDLNGCAKKKCKKGECQCKRK